MRSPLAFAACSILASAIPRSAHAQATKPLPPGIYFLWTPPGPQTAYDGQTPPNVNWVAEQSGRSTNYGLTMPARMDPAEEVNNANKESTYRPRNPAFLDQIWFRLAPEGAGAPDLHLAGNDYATAGVPILLWLSNETVTPEEQIQLTVRVDPAAAPATGTDPIYEGTTGTIPSGTFGSKVHIGIPALPAGAYRVSIMARSLGTGHSRASTRTLIVR